MGVSLHRDEVMALQTALGRTKRDPHPLILLAIRHNWTMFYVQRMPPQAKTCGINVKYYPTQPGKHWFIAVSKNRDVIRWIEAHSRRQAVRKLIDLFPYAVTRLSEEKDHEPKS